MAGDQKATGYDPKGHCGVRKRGGDRAPCRLSKGWGTDHLGIGACRKHLGNSPTHRKAAQKELAAQAVEIYGLSREVEPHEALLEEVYRTAGAVDYLQQQVRAHTGDELVFGGVETASLERPASAQGDKDETPASRRRNEAHGAP